MALLRRGPALSCTDGQMGSQGLPRTSSTLMICKAALMPLSSI
jgi:hypothetical protein